VLSVGRDISEPAAKQAIESATEYREISNTRRKESSRPRGRQGDAVNTPARACWAMSHRPRPWPPLLTPPQAWLVPEDRERYAALIEEHGEVRYYPCQFKRADGSPIWVSVTARRIAGPDGKTLFYQALLKT